MQSKYYKKLGEVVKNYEEVILFGPTDAKVELLHFLRADQSFTKVKITVKQTDKMTEKSGTCLCKKGHFSGRQ